MEMTNLTYTHPRNYGKDSRHCRVCHTTRGLIRKYSLNMCRRCFRERATQIGFVKVLYATAHAEIMGSERLMTVVITDKLLFDSTLGSVGNSRTKISEQ
ncbi:TPA: hypothetical protein N0F65_010890 [Lagenidium giganteum]|uniref:40S ribosomal protein S29 n=2 Tax=Lagenidium giganteum TaxID=4803 RepID=A0AAV2YKE0_9STRA|nr:TPA: hypothetical protein N0F65_010890 [Lagenidium giganteum]